MKTAFLLLGAILATGSVYAQTAAAAQQERLPQLTDLKYPPLPEIKIPEVTTFTLPNGMQVYLLENHELPLIGGSALVRTGNLFDPAEKVGLADITAEVLRTGGTQSRTGEQLDESLESMAAAVESNMGETSASVAFNSLTETVDDVLAVFKDVLTSPAFRQDKIDLVKMQLRGVIQRRNDESPEIASREFTSIVYGRNNPYGWRMEYEHLENVKREDLVNFYQRYYFPSNIRLAIQGDFNTAEMRAKIEKLFADWTVKQDAVPAFPKVPETSSKGVYLAEKGDVNQTQFRLGHQGEILMKNPDYPAISVMSDILGGGFASRLFLNVRTRGGLAYNVGGGYGANYGHPGLFRIAGSTKSESTVQAIGAAILEIEKLRTSLVTDSELEIAKESVMNSFVFYFDHPREVLNRFVVYDYWGYPRDFLFQYQKGVKAVTKQDIQNVAKKYLHPDQLTIVAVGNPKQFGTPMSKLGEVKTIDLTIPQPGQKAAPTDSASVERGKQLLQQAAKAVGGAENLTSIKDMSTTSVVKLNTPQGPMELGVNAQMIRPSTFRVTQKFPFGEVILFGNGEQRWMSSPQGTTDQVPPPVAQQMRGELFRDLPTLLLSDRVPGRSVSAVGENEIRITDSEGEWVQLKIDPKTGLPQEMSYAGVQGPATVTYSDWREVNGIKIPYARTLKVGNTEGTSTVTDIKINSGLSAEALSKKP